MPGACKADVGLAVVFAIVQLLNVCLRGDPSALEQEDSSAGRVECKGEGQSGRTSPDDAYLRSCTHPFTLRDRLVREACAERRDRERSDYDGEVPARLILLALDAFDAALMRRWTAEGKLPAIRGLMERGTSGLVRGPTGFFVGSSWATFYTGLNPAGHGFYRLDQLEPGTYDFFRPLDHATGMGGTPIWTQASAAGLQVAALDTPLARLDQAVNGIHVVGWGDFERPGYVTSPPGLADEIFAAVGEYPRSGVADRPRRTVEEFANFVASLELGVEQKTALTLELLDRDDWDLFMQVFSESHCVGHQCWHLHDPASPAHDPQMAAAIGDPLERVYRAIDRGVGSILERAGNAHVLVFAVHGMSSWRSANGLLDEILYRLGVTTRPVPPPDSVPQPDSRVQRLGKTLYRLKVTDNRLYGRLRARVGGSSASASSYRHPANVFGWAEVASSGCFRVPAGFPVSGIRLNLRGREPQGILNPGRESDAFVEQLANDLLAIVDERTGSALVAAVHRTDSLYAGERRDALPDLMVEWTFALTGTMAHANGRGATVRARSEAIGVVEGTNRYHRTGDHVPKGFFAYAGPGIPVAERKQPVDLVDLYPTICDHLRAPRAGGRRSRHPGTRRGSLAATSCSAAVCS